MSLLNDRQIAELVEKEKMIDPFIDHKVKEGLSYGLEPFGYSIRLGNIFKVYGDTVKVIDPLEKQDMVEIIADSYILQPQTLVLGVSLEYFRLPLTVSMMLDGKSSYYRTGIRLNCTLADAGWHGNYTIAITNNGDLPVKLHAYKGIGQALFFQGEEPLSVYTGKYNGTTKPTEAIMW